MSGTKESKWLLLPAVVAVALGAGCAKKSDEFADDSTSAIDSTLALGDLPAPGLETSEPYQEPEPAPKPKPAPSKPAPAKPAPKPAPRPTPPDEATLAAGTTLHLAMQSELTTKTAQVGDAFTAVVTQPIIVGNRVVVPEGATVYGHVAATSQPGKLSGKGMMQLAFDELEFEGRRYNVASVGDTIWGKSGTGKDAAMIGGGAAAGAVLGKVLGGSAAKGAVIGGAAGTAATLLTRGPQLEMKAGTPVACPLDHAITVTPPPLEGTTQ
jgi:hypothetical protein